MLLSCKKHDVLVQNKMCIIKFPKKTFIIIIPKHISIQVLVRISNFISLAMCKLYINVCFFTVIYNLMVRLG